MQYVRPSLPRSRESLRKSNGFTLLELMICILILGIILTIGLGYLKTEVSYVDEKEVADNVQLTINSLLPESEGWNHRFQCLGTDPDSSGLFGITCVGVSGRDDGSDISKWEMVCSDKYRTKCEIRDID